MSLTYTIWFGTKIFKIVDTELRNISIKSFYSDSTINTLSEAGATLEWAPWVPVNPWIFRTYAKEPLKLETTPDS